jgi:ribosomal protein S18 acetylase RimI-like enzyme
VYEEIRPASAKDVEAIRLIVRDAYSKYVERIGREPAPMSADYAALVASGTVWVATNDRDEPLGVLVIDARPTSLVLENLAVAPGFQGRGIGRALIRFAEDRAIELGLDEVTLYTNEKMTENIALYGSLGYVEVARRREEGFERVFFRKTL